MKIFNKVSVSVVIVAVAFTLGLAWLIGVFAATTPSLGTAVTYGVLGSTYTNTSAGTTINGDVGFTTGPAVDPLGVHTNYGSGAPYATAGTDQDSALSALASQPCTFTFAAGAINLSTDTTHGPIGVYAPGVYCSTGAMDVGGPLTLSGSGTYIFRPVGALTSTDGAVVTLAGGASACDVFWTPTEATTLAANTTFAGTVIDDAGITVGANTTWTGRALAFGGTVTTGDTDTITVPTCAAPASINVVKIVINDNGRTKTVVDFPLFVNGTPVVSGVTNVFPAPATYTVTETADSNYTQTFSGDCDVNGSVNLVPGDIKFCIVTNDDIAAPVTSGGGTYYPPVPPLIDVVKVPSPLALPDGPGLVTYTYTLRNIGTVSVTNVTMVGDTCSPIILVSGDSNVDAKLDVNETWIYTCSTTLSKTHTNIVTATGWANGISAIDIANATVVVGVPLPPPLIHVVKKPSVFVLPAGGGAVTYTYTVTNPGTAPLSDVSITDDKCTGLPGRVSGHPGDLNKNDLLESSEAWSFTCQTNLTQTTINTGTAEGSANGLTARDFAIATVVVSAATPGQVLGATTPSLPNTGFSPEGKSTPWDIVILVGVLMLVSTSLVIVLRKRTI